MIFIAFQKTVDKWKLKKWFQVFAPKVFENKEICEIPANNEKTILNRNLKIGLNLLTNNVYNSNTNLILKIIDVANQSAHTKILRIELQDSYINSIVRKDHNAIETRTPVVSKDNNKIIIKAIAITRQRVANTKIKEIRKEMNNNIEEYCKKLDSDSIVKAFVERKFHSELINKLKKIVPISKVEFKKIELN
ncbi:MAG: hypothetical protein M1168_00455 [Candidatus Marsarchaeota archaeon]|nr:hypothetical protein [Candidatus Marsarchaeota archaeon]MCL5094441.1 hypothetical protein [Candidatus Marsarchaeota archaeon]